MSNISLLILIISFSLLYLCLINTLKNNKFTNDLLFFLLIDMILVFTLSIFYFHFQELNISIIISIFLIFDNILLFKELTTISKKASILTIPYLLYFTYVFIKLLFKIF